MFYSISRRQIYYYTAASSSRLDIRLKTSHYVHTQLLERLKTEMRSCINPKSWYMVFNPSSSLPTIDRIEQKQRGACELWTRETWHWRVKRSNRIFFFSGKLFKLGNAVLWPISINIWQHESIKRKTVSFQNLWWISFNFCHLQSIFSSPEPKAHRWVYSMGRHLSSVCHRPSSVNIFKQHLLWSHEAYSYRISHIASIGRGNK